jgi:hypothetical protein
LLQHVDDRLEHVIRGSGRRELRVVVPDATRDERLRRLVARPRRVDGDRATLQRVEDGRHVLDQRAGAVHTAKSSFFIRTFCGLCARLAFVFTLESEREGGEHGDFDDDRVERFLLLGASVGAIGGNVDDGCGDQSECIAIDSIIN